MNFQEKNPKVEFFFQSDSKWKKEYTYLRHIILKTKLNEELKWGVPCYCLKQKNVVLIHGFKNYCALLFHKGVLLKDPNNILTIQTENVQSARQLRFENMDDIVKHEKEILIFIENAIEIEEKGLKVEMKKTSEYAKTPEFDNILKKSKALKIAFESLTPGRQRAYLLFFSSAKLEKTRLERIENNIPRILEGLGLND